MTAESESGPTVRPVRTFFLPAFVYMCRTCLLDCYGMLFALVYELCGSLHQCR